MGSGASAAPPPVVVIPAVTRLAYDVLEACTDSIAFATCAKTGAGVYIKSQYVNKPTAKGSLERELSIVRYLHNVAPDGHHQGVVALIEAFQYRGLLCVVFKASNAFMDLFDAIDTGEMDGSLNQKVCGSLAEAVAHLHLNDVVHMDIKPENVFVEDLKTGRVRLGDFGMARRLYGERKLQHRLGTPTYMAPEVFQKRLYDPMAADVYSLGLTFLMIVDHHHPYCIPDTDAHSMWEYSRLFVGYTGEELAAQYKVFLAAVRLRQWPGLDAAFLDLFYGMVQEDPSQRLTIEQVLQHKWLRTGGGTDAL